MILVGLITIKSLPVAQFPDITPPTVMVSTTYPGADAKTVAETVGAPIEEQVNGIEGMMYMSSTSSSDGSYSLTITFENGTDVDEAAVKVQNQIAMADAMLPSSVKQQGIMVATKSSNIVLFIALQADDSKRYDALYLTNYAQLNIVNDLARLKGVGGVSAFGAGEYSMRVWLDPAKMKVRGITPADVSAMIQSQNMAVSAGSVGAPPTDGNEQFEFTLTSNGRLSTPEEFENIILKTGSDGSILRLGDIATVDMGSQTYSQISHVSGKEAGLIAVNQLPGANALDVAHRVENRMQELAKYFPQGVHYKVVLDTTKFVDASIEELLVTFVETTLIVMIVILIFLQNARATIIPMITIPVSLIATFAVMKVLGFSINTLTLFGLVLAIAIVVDDAIVVVEDCARLVDKGDLTPKQAALKAMDELQGPVIGEVLVLLSVFIPTAFISGITGELYKQFALTIAVSTAFSGFNALTFTPAMCALFLRPRKQTKFFLYRWFDVVYNKVANGYNGLVGKMLRHPMVSLVIFVVIIAAAFWGFTKWPTSYVPEEDMGYYMTSVQLPPGASLQRTDSVMRDIATQVEKFPEVENVVSVAGTSFMGGGNGGNVGSMFVVLKPWKERQGKGHDVKSVIERTYGVTAPIQEAIVYSINPPSIPGLGMTSGLEMQLLDINDYGSAEMDKAVSAVVEAASKDPRFASVMSLNQSEVPQFNLKIDRDKVKLMGLTLNDVYSTISSFMGGTYVNNFIKFDRNYEVNISAMGNARANVEDIYNLTVRNANGDMVPVGAFATVEQVMGAPTVSRYNMYRTATITATPAHGVSSSEGIKALEEVVTNTLGKNYSYAWTGEAYQETNATTTISVVLIFALVITFLVLAAQYESWTDPLAVIITTPTAILGTVLGCIFMDQSISIYTQIGIILLLGMAAKNAILIVEYAMDYRKAGETIRKAAQDAGAVRFRPIVMTALAFVLGVMPMLFATGAGAASRLSLGTAVVFGMAVNAVVGTLFVPNFWELLQTFREKYLSKIFAGSDAPVSPKSTDATQQDDNNT